MNILLEKRKELNLTISGVAKQIGVAPSTYERWESGKAVGGGFYNKTLDAIRKLAMLYEISQVDVEYAIANNATSLKRRESYVSKLTNIRRNNNLTVEGIADLAGVKPEIIKKIEAGISMSISSLDVENLSMAYDLTKDEFFVELGKNIRAHKSETFRATPTPNNKVVVHHVEQSSPTSVEIKVASPVKQKNIVNVDELLKPLYGKIPMDAFLNLGDALKHGLSEEMSVNSILKSIYGKVDFDVFNQINAAIVTATEDNHSHNLIENDDIPLE